MHWLLFLEEILLPLGLLGWLALAPAPRGWAFEPEPGFYTGAMYITYAFTTGIVLVVGAWYTTCWATPTRGCT